MQLLGARGGAAGRVDMHDHGARARRAAKTIEGLDTVVVGAEKTLDGDPRDVAAAAGQLGAGSQQRRTGYRHDDGEQDGKNPPERELAPHSPAVDDDVGIERHGRAPSTTPGTDDSSRQCRRMRRRSTAGRRYSFSSSFSGSPLLRLSAAPRMSPSEAPESDEPY
jgi:hypothetical protein